MLYSLDEICLTPAPVSEVKHRSDVVIYNTHNKLTLFSAQMSCVIDNDSAPKFEEAGINTIIPRNIEWEGRYLSLVDGMWTAVGLKEAQYILDELDFENTRKIRLCIDQANGHMKDLLQVCFKLKTKFGDRIRIMTGNVANPKAYKEYAWAGVDYIRCSVGSGSCCTTSVQTGMHYPMGSLIINLNEERKKLETEIAFGAKYLSVPKIVADGGFKRIDQIVKALALGADYVMLGEVLAKSFEACGEAYYVDNDKRIYRNLDDYPATHREYYGMSTEKAQRIVNEASRFRIEDFEPKHSEGQVRSVPIQYHIKEWVADFEHALRSSMSYANARTLKEFIGEVEFDYMTPVTYNAYMK